MKKVLFAVVSATALAISFTCTAQSHAVDVAPAGAEQTITGTATAR